jgi:PAS domain S-box-containing protein
MKQKETLAIQLREQVSWLTALSNVGRSVTSTLNLNTVLRRIVESGVYLTRADQGFIALAEPHSDQLCLRAVKNVDEQHIDTFRIPVKDSLVGQALENKRPIRKTRETREPGLKVSTGFLVHSLIHVPIIYRGHSLGVLSVNNHIQSREFTEKDEAVLTSLADYAAIALENANSFAQAQEEIKERERIAIALKESEERYALAVNGANDGIWDWDLQTDKIYYAPRWKAILGYQDDEIGDTPDEWFQRIFKDDFEYTRFEISAHIRKRTSHFVNEHRLLHKDGFTALFFLMLFMSHLFLDLITVDKKPPIGIPLFWPISSKYFLFPVSIFSDMERSNLLMHAGKILTSLLREVIIVGIPLIFSKFCFRSLLHPTLY